MKQLWVVRHGETEWARSGRHTGRSDIALTEDGRAQAQGLGPVLAAHDFALVLTSPLRRAADTARLAGLEPEVDDDLVEWDYGDYEGRTAADIREERPGWLVWRDGVPGGERPEEVAARADRVIARADAADGDTCVVAHGHLLRMVAVRWLGQGPEFGARLPRRPAGFGVLGWEREARALRAWGATS